jgi:hypothetical protein
METKKFVVHNETRGSFLSPSVTSVNAALEPLKVLKVLIEGLPANSRTGLWLINFKGVPVARTLSPFDLVYLDKELRIVHSLELSKDSEFAPFRGQPSSALVLPPQSISSSQTRDGDTLDFRALESTIPEDAKAEESVAAPERAGLSGEPFSRGRNRDWDPPIFTPPTAIPSAPAGEFQLQSSNSPTGLSAFQAPPPSSVSADADTSAPVPSAGTSAPAELESPDQPSPGSIPISSVRGVAAQSAKRSFVSGPILTSHAPELKKAPAPEEKPSPSREPIPFPGTRNASPAIQEVQPTEASITLFPQQRFTAKPQQDSMAASATSAPAVEPAKPLRISSIEPAGAAASAAPVPAEPVPFRPQEAPQYDPIPDYGPVPKPKYSWKIRLLRWLFPDLVIREATRPRDRRRADRQALPGLIAFFFTGGAPEPQRISNISVTGFYLETEERWMPGTVVRMTLQKVGSTGEGPADTLTVNSRIVRWGPDGEGFEFILTDLEE